MKIRSGKAEGFPYSLSRWTDLSASKWPWFRERLEMGWMYGIDPRNGVPTAWSLVPEDTLGLIFWTRNSRNILKDADLLQPYRKVFHFTLTGWHEVELRAPGIQDGLAMLRDTVQAFGAENVMWRFSPVPTVEDCLDRFNTIAEAVQGFGLSQVYVAFLQTNDMMKEPREAGVRASLLRDMALAQPNLKILLCNEDRTLREAHHGSGFANCEYGICEDGNRFGYGIASEGCGCALAVDPFTITEACVMGCKYCYAADENISRRKKNTTKEQHFLPVLQVNRARST